MDISTLLPSKLEYKTCNTCGITKPVIDFYPKVMRKSWGYTSDCRLCISRKCEIYRKNNKEKKSAAGKLYYQNNKDKYRVWGAKRNGKPQTEKRKLYLANYHKTHRKSTEVNSINCANRRARRRNAKGDLTNRIWNEIVNFYGNKCLSCGRSDVKITIDHIIPLFYDGKNSVNNVQPLCFSCNSRKGTKTIDYRGDKIYGQ